MEAPLPGQRWVSDSEPELGLGVVMKAEFGRVEIFFPAANEHRQFAMKSAPLRRVRYQPGDSVKLHDGSSLEITAVEDRRGMLHYLGKGRTASESELSDTISFSKPEDRLLAGQIDEARAFDLRVEALQRRADFRQSPVRGFCGGRVDLLSHQMSIAAEVAGRLLPRVLLADEVGLGKTIEACLILHRLHLTGRAERMLILVPEPLIHQWFVELFRRFHLLFALFDEARCDSIETNEENSNPFLDSQLVICGTGFLAGSPERARQAAEAGWDLLIVDEAHHLEWSPQAASPAYTLVENLAARIPGLLLLTATPQQLGPEGHFARLRLLDPNRYADLEAFLAEAVHYEELARAIDRLLAGKKPNAADEKLFMRKSPHLQERLAEVKAGTEGARSRLAAALLDEFGTGRVMFRNTRAALGGFPERRARLAPLASDGEEIEVKVKWLAGLLAELGEAKVLLICSSRARAQAVQEHLLHETAQSAALFHEGLTLLQRDRQAAWFAEEEGARVLISSEIGSEGRNFQFAHHLVLFDLPRDPELLEQRIGRLDRIGQTSTIQIHVPFQRGSAEEVLARWYHEGLCAFEENLHGATEIANALRPRLEALLAQSGDLSEFLSDSRELRQSVAQKLERGHDRLLELNSHRPELAETVIEAVRNQDADANFEEFFIRLVDHFGMHVEELGNRSYFLLPGNLTTDSFPALPDEGLTVTFDRRRALARENVGFLTPDHPMVRAALDLLLGSEAGNSSFGLWRGAGAEGLMLETHFVVECVAPAALHADRFLPAIPVRVVVDHTKKDRRKDAAYRHMRTEKGSPSRLLENAGIKHKLFPAMLARARQLAETELAVLAETAVKAARAQLGDEIARLEDLARLNDHVRPEEIEALRAQQSALEQALGDARLRLDAVRLVLQAA